MAVDLNELRKLALLLPPNLRVNTSEVADVVSALAAVVSDGEAIVKAANEGPQAVVDHFYAKQAKDHEARGIAPPTRGQPPVQVAHAPQQGTSGFVTTEHLETFKRELLGALSELAGGQQAQAAGDAPPAPPAVPGPFAPSPSADATSPGAAQ